MVQWARPERRRARQGHGEGEGASAEFERAIGPQARVHAPAVSRHVCARGRILRRASRSRATTSAARRGSCIATAPSAWAATTRPIPATARELYAVIGQSPRGLDRNITLVGRVVRGIELLSVIPRGHGAMGFYEKAAGLRSDPLGAPRRRPPGERAPRISKRCAPTARRSRRSWRRARTGARSGSRIRSAASACATCRCRCA